MKFAVAISVLLPYLTAAFPILERDDAATGPTIQNIDLSSLVSGDSLEYTDGMYNIYALFDNLTFGAHDDEFVPALKKLSFPVNDGKLVVKDGTGSLVGYVTPGSQGTFAIQLNSTWAANPSANPTPNITSAKEPPSGMQRRAVKPKARVSSKIGKYNGMGGDAQIYADLVEAIVDWIRIEYGWKRDDSSSSQLLTPVFVQGPGVTFEAVLGLQNVVYLGSSLASASAGDLMIDIDNALDFENCSLCLLPVSNM